MSVEQEFLNPRRPRTARPFPRLLSHTRFALKYEVWLRLTCALGFHLYGRGPSSMEGDKPADLILAEGRLVPETCMFGNPWCRAKRLTPIEEYPDWRSRLSIWRMMRRTRPRKLVGSSSGEGE